MINSYSSARTQLLLPFYVLTDFGGQLKAPAFTLRSDLLNKYAGSID